MDVTPPGAAGRASRPSRSTPSGIPLVLRRLAIGLAGAALAVLAGVACALSFDDLRALAVTGRAEPQLAYLYPTAFDVLLVVALVSVPLLRGARFLVRSQAGFVLLLLLASAAAADAATAVGVSFDPDATALVVALLPWVMLAVGLWLLLLLLKHVRTNRADLDGDSDDGLVPFDGDHRAAVTAPSPVAVQTRPARVSDEHAAPPLQPIPEAVAPSGYVPPPPVGPVSETVAPPEYAPPLPTTPSQAGETGSRAVTPGIPENAVPSTPSVTDEDGVRPQPEAPLETAAEAGSAATAGDADREPDESEALPVVPPTAAPATPPVTEPAEPAPRPAVKEPEPVPQPAVTEPEPSTETAVGEHTRDDMHTRDTEPVVAETPAQPVPETASPAETDDRQAQRQPRRNRPVRWGDLVRPPHAGDVLVHPRPKPEKPAGSEPSPEDEADVDTQPLRHIRDVPGSAQTPDEHAPDHTDAGSAQTPDPAQTADCADPGEQGGTRRPYAAEEADQGVREAGDDTEERPEEGIAEGTVPMAPPSGRLRSTPRPPA